MLVQDFQHYAQSINQALMESVDTFQLKIDKIHYNYTGQASRWREHCHAKKN